MTDSQLSDVREEELLDQVENIGGPRFRRLEEKADGRDLMTWEGVLGHIDEDLTDASYPELAALLIEERAGWIAHIARQDDDHAADFIAYYLDEDDRDEE